MAGPGANFMAWPRWSPYAVGAGIGVLSWVTFLAMNKALGVSTTFVRAAGAIEGALAPAHVQSNGYFAKYLVGKPAFEWQFALVMMLAVGALIAAKLAGSKRVEHVPAIWAARFGPSRWKRYAGAFLGGAIVLFGARLAGGCTSGHALSGGMQLAISGWVFLGTMFASGVLAAMLIYRPGSAGKGA